MKGDALDPKALIREAYRIDGITEAECRSIFMDWALSLPEGTDARAAMAILRDRHGAAADHPMTRVLSEGAAAPQPARRRGGWRGRRPARER